MNTIEEFLKIEFLLLQIQTNKYQHFLVKFF